MKIKVFILGCLIAFTVASHSIQAQGVREYYELRVWRYHTHGQEILIDQFLEKAFLPALHRMGISGVGVFKPIETDTVFKNRVYVLIPASSLSKLMEVNQAIMKDVQLAQDGSSYLNAVPPELPFDRIESTILTAFRGKTQMTKPKLNQPRSGRIYELRSYEGPTERLYENKVKMFNAGDEIGLFERLQFNAVFYGEVLVGSKMPNLMYMTTFEDMKSRDAHWALFVDDPQWKKLKDMSEYQHNVSKIEIYLLHPTAYSDY